MFQKDSIRRADELVDGYVLVRQLLDESYDVTTVHGRMRCGYSGHPQQVTVEEVVAACRSATEVGHAFGQPPVPLIPVEDVVRIEQARKRGCEDVIDVYSDRTGNMVATGP